MATSIPPHNLGEICDALIRVIDEPDVSIDELLEIVPGPDFPTGGIVCGRGGIRRGYHTGRSTIVRPRPDPHRGARQEPLPHRRHARFPSSRPATASRSGSPQLVNEGKIAGISAIRNESDLKEPVRLVLELKRDADPGHRAQPALPVLAAARHLLADLPGAGRRQAAGAVASRSCWRSSSATARRSSAAARSSSWPRPGSASTPSRACCWPTPTSTR